MKFGIFFELSTPRPFSREHEFAVYHNALEQCRLADELGFDHVWAVEHHFLEEYSHCSAPEVFLTAVAAQTERVRVGHGAVVREKNDGADYRWATHLMSRRSDCEPGATTSPAWSSSSLRDFCSIP